MEKLYHKLDSLHAPGQMSPEKVKNMQWFAIQTHTLREPIAGIHLKNQGFEVYLPRIRTFRRHARRTNPIVKAFFPGYLFIHLAPEERRWETIAGTRGVIRPVRFGEHYPAVPDWVIENLHSIEDINGLIILDGIYSEKFKQGDKVRVSMIASLEQTGVFQGLHGNDRALILLDILQREVAAIVPLEKLSPLNYC